MKDILTLREKHEYEQEIAQLKESFRVLSAQYSDLKARHGKTTAKASDKRTKALDNKKAIAIELIAKRLKGEGMRLQEIANISGLTYWMTRKLSSMQRQDSTENGG